MQDINNILDEPYSSLYQEDKMSAKDVNTALREKNNVASEIRIHLKVPKANAERAKP